MTDLTKINTPFGELDDATKGALLLAHWNGAAIEFRDDAGGIFWTPISDPTFMVWKAYRVQPPAPVVASVTMHGVNADYHSIYPAATEGYGPDVTRLTFTFPTRDGLHVPGVYTSPDGLQVVIEVAE